MKPLEVGRKYSPGVCIRASKIPHHVLNDSLYFDFGRPRVTYNQIIQYVP
jgi:hypothetical protein